jgi:hypothetical protein
MVQTSALNDTKTEMITDDKYKTSIPFLPWKAYNACENGKKITLFQEDKKWNNIFRSVVVEGFIDNGDNLQMHQNKVAYDDKHIDQMVQNDAKYNPTVSEYLRNITHPLLGHNMFDYVYPSIMGKRDFIILVDS